jgi:hypothetical protein
MSIPNAVAADRLVHVIVEQGGRRTFFHHTERVQDDKTKQWFTVPVVDDDPAGSKPMRFDIALVCKRRWTDELGLAVRLALDTTGPYIDEYPGMNMLPWEHRDYLVSVDRDGKPFDSFDAPCVYRVIATHTPSGKMFCLRFNHANLQNQAVYATLEEGPETCVARAFERGFTKLEPPQVNPYLEVRRQEAARQEAEQAKRIPGLRPGDIGR